MIAADPFQGGAAWAILQYILGLERLGHDVVFVEPIAGASVRPSGAPLADSVNASYFREVAERHGFSSRAALVLADTRETFGMTRDALRRACADAVALVNISGLLDDPELTGAIPVRVYLDLDPAFNQLWHAVEGIDRRFSGHTHHASVGGELGRAGCAIPVCGIEWIPTLPPVVLDHWPVSDANPGDAWTTVANWRGYGSVHHEGVHFGQKAHSFRRFMGLPSRARERFRVALSIHPDETSDLAALRGNGWELADPVAEAGTPWDYAGFVSGSRGEIGIAKSGYVASRCGWFSDRSACYLASGRPVVAQETGFSNRLPSGRGLIAFDDEDGALAAIDSVRADYKSHARAARAVAEEYLDSDKVLRRLLNKVGVAH